MLYSAFIKTFCLKECFRDTRPIFFSRYDCIPIWTFLYREKNFNRARLPEWTVSQEIYARVTFFPSVMQRSFCSKIYHTVQSKVTRESPNQNEMKWIWKTHQYKEIPCKHSPRWKRGQWIFFKRQWCSYKKKTVGKLVSNWKTKLHDNHAKRSKLTQPLSSWFCFVWSYFGM